MNNNTSLIEVGLVEEIHTDKENTDKPVMLASAKSAPYVVSVGVIVEEGGASGSQGVLPIIPVVDADGEEMGCLDQVLHVAVSQTLSPNTETPSLKIHSLVQSKGEGSIVSAGSCIAGIPAALFLKNNF